MKVKKTVYLPERPPGSDHAWHQCFLPALGTENLGGEKDRTACRGYGKRNNPDFPLIHLHIGPPEEKRVGCRVNNGII